MVFPSLAGYGHSLEYTTVTEMLDGEELFWKLNCSG
jgi:hypothetical protein